MRSMLTAEDFVSSTKRLFEILGRVEEVDERRARVKTPHTLFLTRDKPAIQVCVLLRFQFVTLSSLVSGAH